MNDYITDPELLKQLGEPTESNYVTDPELLKQLGSPTPVEPNVNVAPQAMGAAVGAVQPASQVAKTVGGMAVGSAKDIAKMGSILYNNLTPGVVAEVIGSPITKGKEFASAYIEGHPWAGKAVNVTPAQAVATGGRFLGGAATNIGAGIAHPFSAFSMPYQAAAYEQEKIRANPTAPEYATNPYAQQYRGEAATQGQAGAMNRRGALINQQYGGLTAEQQQILQQDRLRQQEIQDKKNRARQVLQQPPTAQNFIERMTALTTLYGNINQG